MTAGPARELGVGSRPVGPARRRRRTRAREPRRHRSRRVGAGRSVGVGVGGLARSAAVRPRPGPHGAVAARPGRPSAGRPGVTRRPCGDGRLLGRSPTAGAAATGGGASGRLRRWRCGPRGDRAACGATVAGRSRGGAGPVAAVAPAGVGPPVIRSGGSSTTAVVPPYGGGPSRTSMPCRSASRPTTNSPSRAVSARSNSGGSASRGSPRRDRLGSCRGRGPRSPSRTRWRTSWPVTCDRRVRRRERRGVLHQLGEQVDDVADGAAGERGRLDRRDRRPACSPRPRPPRRGPRRPSAPGRASPGRAPRRTARSGSPRCGASGWPGGRPGTGPPARPVSCSGAPSRRAARAAGAAAPGCAGPG